MSKQKKLPKSSAKRYGHSSHVPKGSAKFLGNLDNSGFFDYRIAMERRMLGVKKGTNAKEN